MTHTTNHRILVSFHVNLDHADFARKLSVSKELINCDAANRSGRNGRFKPNDRAIARICTTGVLKTYSPLNVRNCKLVNLEWQLVYHHVLAGTSSGNRIGFKQNGVLDLICQQQANRTNVCTDVEQDPPV